jgi:hypothetical protein
MDLYKYRYVKRVPYKRIWNAPMLMEQINSKMLRFLRESKLVYGDFICFDFRLFVEKNGKK